MSKTGLAYAGSGLGYQAASLIAGGPAPLLATWMLANFGWQAIAVYIIACVVLTLIAVILLPDRSRTDLGAPSMLTPVAGPRQGPCTNGIVSGGSRVRRPAPRQSHGGGADLR